MTCWSINWHLWDPDGAHRLAIKWQILALTTNKWTPTRSISNPTLFSWPIQSMLGPGSRNLVLLAGWVQFKSSVCDNKVQSILGWSHPRFSLRVQSKPPFKIWNQFDSSHCPYDLYFRLWLSRTQFRLIRIWVLVYMLHIWWCWYFSCVSLEFPSFFCSDLWGFLCLYS